MNIPHCLQVKSSWEQQGSGTMDFGGFHSFPFPLRAGSMLTPLQVSPLPLCLLSPGWWQPKTSGTSALLHAEMTLVN